MRFVLCVFLLFGSTTVLAGPKRTEALTPQKVWLQKELTRLKFSKAFIKDALSAYEESTFKTVVTLNLLGFLQKPGQHMNHVNSKSVRESGKFIQEHQKAFELADEKYQVPASVISSLLWIETRHGEDIGKFHTTSVFLHLLQSDLKANRKELIRLALEKNQDLKRYSNQELRTKMLERTKAKKLWAREQLVALAVLKKQGRMNLKTLRGSFAGAFGMPQFIPSSYRDYAQGLSAKSAPDLYNEGDAIISVANYLSKHGWKNADENARVEALMKYNNSRDYADSILEISKRVPSPASSVRSRTASADPEGSLIDK